MKKTVILITTALVTIFSASHASAQDASPKAGGDHNIALGLRFSPDGAGFTGKFFLSDAFAIEAQLNGGGVVFGDPSFAAVGLAEYHITLPQPEWRLYFGGGLHLGTWDRNGDHNPEGIFGIDGIFGVEYNFTNIPLELSADIKPAVNFVSTPDFFPNNFFGVSGRFYLPPARRK